MKFPVIIQHHPKGWIVDIPDDFFKKKGNPISREELIDKRISAIGKEVRDAGNVIPEKWRKSCKQYSGVVYGLETTLSAWGDTKEEVIEILKRKVSELAIGFAGNARTDWPHPFEIDEIEI